MKIQRRHHQSRILGLLERHPVVGLVGARQVGKTTLAHDVARARQRPFTVFDLENPADLARLADPMLALSDLEGTIVIDEVQLRPNLFPVLRVLADRAGTAARFLVLGSASPSLLQQSAESLAGRIAYYPLDGFSLSEVGSANLEQRWLRGGFPRAYLAASDDHSFEWRRNFVQTFLARDLPQLGLDVPTTAMHRFWTMLAHNHGQTWNASMFARAFGVADTTVRRYLDMLTASFVVRPLQPWHENIRKRQVKTPKIYLSDTGLLHSLLNLREREDLLGHPIVGASWEGFVIDTVIARLGATPDETHFWATHAGAELDLLVVRGQRRLGFEIKRTVAPKRTRSMAIALEDLRLDRLDVVHAGSDTFPLADKIRAVAIDRLWADLEPL